MTESETEAERLRAQARRALELARAINDPEAALRLKAHGRLSSRKFEIMERAIRRLSHSRLRNDSGRAPLSSGFAGPSSLIGPASPISSSQLLAPPSAGLFFAPLPSPSACPADGSSLRSQRAFRDPVARANRKL